jgi:hypothetical protein
MKPSGRLATLCPRPKKCFYIICRRAAANKRPDATSDPLTVSLLAAPWALEKKQEKPEPANSLEKKQAKVELCPAQEKLPAQPAVSSIHA